MAENINIALGLDNKYFPYAGVLMTSILFNAVKERFVFHVAMSEKISSDNNKKKNDFNRLYKNAQIKIYDFANEIEDLPNLSQYTDKRFNKSILLRILLPRVLKNINRIIYLDADILCIGNLRRLWDLSIPQEYIIAASRYKKKNEKEQIKRIGLKDEHYFNSGVILIDVKKWQKFHITKAIIDCYKKFHEFFILPDQDAINIILQKRIYTLPYMFNRMLAANDITLDGYEKEDLLLHFVNETKPWIKGNTPVIKALYKKYVNESLWADLHFIEPNTPKQMLLAGRNYEEIGDYKSAAYYYGSAARDLWKEYLYKVKDSTL